MSFKVDDIVCSKICYTLIGRVSKILDDNNFLLQVHSGKEIICHHNFYILVKE